MDLQVITLGCSSAVQGETIFCSEASILFHILHGEMKSFMFCSVVLYLLNYLSAIRGKAICTVETMVWLDPAENRGGPGETLLFSTTT